MANAPGSSKRPKGPLEGDWESFSVTRAQLNRLTTEGYLHNLDFTSFRPGLQATDIGVITDNYPTPHGEE